MYDELKKSLRECCGTDSYICNCENCIMKDKRKDGDYTECVDALGLAAADAIEELSADLERSKEYEAFWEKEANEALRKFQLAVANKPRWIPVTERMPSADGFTLIFTARGHAGVCYFTNGWWGGYDKDGITHWMPLPEPPKEG